MTWKRSHRTLFAELVLYLLNVQRIWPNIRLFQFSMLLQNHDTSYEYLRFPSHVYFLCIEGKYSIKFIVGSRFKKKTKKYHYTFCVWSNLIHNSTENLKTNYHKKTSSGTSIINFTDLVLWFKYIIHKFNTSFVFSWW